MCETVPLLFVDDMTEQLSKRVSRTRNKALANPGLVLLNINIHVNVDYVDVSIVSIVSM